MGCFHRTPDDPDFQKGAVLQELFPWHTNSIFIIIQNSKLYKFIPRYAAFARGFGTFPPPRHLFPMAYGGILWHIFPTKGSIKSSKFKKFFKFTTWDF